MIRRRLFALLALAAACGMAQGQAYPTKPIRVIIPSTPGGGTANVRIPQPSGASSLAPSMPHAWATDSRIAPWSGCPAPK